VFFPKADTDQDGKLSFDEFTAMVANTVSKLSHICSQVVFNKGLIVVIIVFLQDIVRQMTLEDLVSVPFFNLPLLILLGSPVSSLFPSFKKRK
jgi:hypothetical protein